MVAFIDDHRKAYGVEPICRVLPIAPSTYFRHTLLDRDPTRRSPRAQQDAVFRALIRRIWTENYQVYGPRTSGNKCAARVFVSRGVGSVACGGRAASSARSAAARGRSRRSRSPKPIDRETSLIEISARHGQISGGSPI
jgi:hypothetical protein